jgi:UDP-N-acetyl-D-glucosamine dehydrogenase
MRANVGHLERKVRERTAKVAVVGLGYAGLPMAVEIARAGFMVIGYDLDKGKVAAIRQGKSPVSNVSSSDIAPLQVAGRLRATTSPRTLATVDVVIICVPTPLTDEAKPDMGFVARAGNTIAQRLRPGMLVILQSTCSPGTTSGLLKNELERVSGLHAGQDFHLVFAPERIDPGNTVFTVRNTPKLVGGTCEESSRLACILFETFIDTVIPVGAPEVAEMAKLVENTFRFINISFVNETALLCERLGVNVWEVIEAAKTKPFAFMPHYPSAGVGGHCIPVVPFYLEAAAREVGLDSELIRAANRINHMMPGAIVDKIEAALLARGKPLSGARLLLVGVTYKPDTADVRESAALRVFEEAVKRRALVTYHDPLVTAIGVAGERIASVALTPWTIAAADVVVLLTQHSTLDYDLVLREATLVVDTHGGLSPRSGANVVNVWQPQSPGVSKQSESHALREAA